MKKIKLVKINLVNFLSFVDETIIFPTTDGFRLLTGLNLSEEQLGANGAGKSSLWEAICFALYGTGVKGKKLSGLVTWEEKELSVILELLINDVTHVIRRYGPPMRIEVDGKAAEQKDVDELVNLNKERFIHSVIFGQGVKLFPDLTIPERVDLFDEVLDLSIWSKCLQKASDKVADLQKQLGRLKIDVAFYDGRLNALESDEYLKRMIDQWEVTHQNNLLRVEEKIAIWDKQKDELIEQAKFAIEQWKQNVIKEAEETAELIDKLEQQKKAIEEKPDQLIQLDLMGKRLLQLQSSISQLVGQRISIRENIERITKEATFWSSNECPSCGRAITESEKTVQLLDIGSRKAGLEADLRSLTKSLDTLSAEEHKLKKEYDEISLQITRDEIEIQQIDSSIFRLQREGAEHIKLYDAGKTPYDRDFAITQLSTNPYLEEKANLENALNPHNQRLEFVTTERTKIETEKKEITDQQKALDEKLLATTYWQTGFKRIRLFFVQQILDALQIEIKAAMASLGLEGWDVRLCTESETKSGTTKLGIQIHVKSRTAEAPWEAWSGGESQRLRLAIAQGLGSLIQRAAGVWWDWEVWDEPTNWLSEKGIEDLLESLSYRAQTYKKQVWLVDHRALTFSGFNDIWTVTKDQKGSKICS